MTAFQIVFGIIFLIVSLVAIFAVIMQQGHRAGISGVIAGGADTFLSKNKARTADAILKRLTKWLVALFLVLAVVGVIVF